MQERLESLASKAREEIGRASEASGLELRCGEVAVAAPAVLAGVDPRVAPVAAGLAVAEVHS